MKRIFILLAAVCAAGAARGDLVMQQQITTPNHTEVTTLNIKGNKVRMDRYAGQPQALSVIKDLSTGEEIALLHTQKMYVKSPGKSKNQTRAGGTASTAPVPRATGKTQKVGDYDTELYEWSNARGIKGTAWVAKSYPDFARIRADLVSLDKATSGNNDTTPDLGTLPGMMMRTQVTGETQTITLALISARETTLDASLFGIPREYKEMPRPKPLKQMPPPNTPAKTPAANKAAVATPAAGSSPTTSGSKRVDNSKTAPADYSTQKPPAW